MKTRVVREQEVGMLNLVVSWLVIVFGAFVLAVGIVRVRNRKVTGSVSGGAALIASGVTCLVVGLLNLL